MQCVYVNTDSGAIKTQQDRCTACGNGKFKVADGPGDCAPCPAHSTTVVSSKDCGGDGKACKKPSDCICQPGFSGTITTPSSTCKACVVGQYKQTTDVIACAKCPADSTTQGTASKDIQDCHCSAGHSGILAKLGDTCKPCPVGQYDDGTKVTATCTSCPTFASTSSTMSKSVADCACGAGYYGTLTNPISTCTPCVQGTYAATAGSTNCIKCPHLSSTESTATKALTDCTCVAGATGTISKPSDTCTSCAVATYKSATGPATCTACPTGATTTGCTNKDGTGCTDASECLCTKGYFGPQPVTSCTACPIGQYANEVGEDQCQYCPTSSSTADTHSDSVTDCVCFAGYSGIINTGADSCTACPVGQFLGESAADCNPCPQSATTAQAASTAAIDCNCLPGYSGVVTSPTDTCNACDKGKYLGTTNAAACIECPKDATTVTTASKAVTECQCEKGSSGTITQPSDKCTQCPAGQYADAEGEGTCTKCPDNSDTAQPGSNAITDCKCKPGFFGTITKPDGRCSACDVGTYSDAPGLTACKTCPTSSTTSSSASTMMSECLCMAGFTGTINTPDAKCNACAVGTYKSVDGVDACKQCPPQSSTTSMGSTALSDCECASGYYGAMPTCTTCAIGQYKTEAGPQDCDYCPTDSSNPAPGSTDVKDCKCKPGYAGTLSDPSSTCVACQQGQYNPTAGSAVCTKCPTHAGTKNGGSSIAVTDCLCSPGCESLVCNT